MRNSDEGVAISYRAHEKAGYIPTVDLVGPHVKAYLSALQLRRLSEVLLEARKDLDPLIAGDGPALPAPSERVLEDGRREVVRTSTEIHPAWCSPADCIHEHGEAPSHRSVDFKCVVPGAAEDFDAVIIQDALAHAEILSYGPSWDVPITPSTARAYARMLIRVADIAEGKTPGD